MRFSARVFGILFSFIFLIFALKPAFAQNTNYQQQGVQTYNQTLNTNTDPGVSNNLHNLTQNVMLEVMSSMICQLVGVDPINTQQQCLGIDKNTGRIGFVQNGGGAIGLVTSMIAMTFTPSVRFGDYVAYVSNNFGIVKNANADINSGTYQASTAGFEGLNSLTGILIVWTAFRNIAYLLFILIFLAIGIAIMLRLRIDPRTVMTVQNQIPKIIVGLVLVTFSFAIAGFLIDMMWVGTYTVTNVLRVGGLNLVEVDNATSQGAPGFINSVYNGGIIGIANNSADSVGQLIANLFTSNPKLANPPTNGSGACNGFICQVANFLNDPIGNIVGTILWIVIHAIVGMIAFLIIAIALIVQLFKLWFALIKTYVYIILMVIFAPFWILAGMIPGASPSVGFTSWLRTLVGNLVVFPAVIGLFLIGRIILDSFAATGSANAFIPPLIGNATGTSGGALFGAIIALGIILSAPGFVESIKKAFKSSGPGFGFGGISTGSAALGAIGGAIGSRLYYRDRYGNVQGSAGTFVTNRIAGLQGSNNRVARGVGQAANFVARPTQDKKARIDQTPASAATAGETDPNKKT